MSNDFSFATSVCSISNFVYRTVAKLDFVPNPLTAVTEGALEKKKESEGKKRKEKKKAPFGLIR